jgi:hypothetical protein
MIDEIGNIFTPASQETLSSRYHSTMKALAHIKLIATVGRESKADKKGIRGIKRIIFFLFESNGWN